MSNGMKKDIEMGKKIKVDMEKSMEPAAPGKEDEHE